MTSSTKRTVYSDHEVIAAPTALKKKAVTRAAKGDDWDVSALQRAEAAMAELANEFDTWMADEVAKLEKARQAIHRAPKDTEVRAVLYRASHDIRGQAETFGYPFAGASADGLCDLLDVVPETDRTLLALIDAHVDAIRAVVAGGVKGNTDPKAREVLDELHAARVRIAPQIVELED